jgi:hypothetical protein
MRHRNVPSTAVAALLLMAQWPVTASAQLPVTKPTTTSTIRLRAPSPVVASQQADGTIIVRWPAVPGAATYQVTRSVPPTPAGVVANPTDTTYVDTNVQAGSTYYYLLGAVDSAGMVGMKAGSTPVTARLSSTTTTGGTTTTTSTGGSPSGGATGGTLAAPTAIIAESVSPSYVNLYWRFTQSGMSYRIERAVPVSAKGSGTWQVRQTTPPLPCCFSAVGDSASPTSSTYIYRITTVDPSAPTRTSAPVQTPQVITNVSWTSFQNGNVWVIRPTDVVAKTVKVGSSLGALPGAALSTDTTVVAIGAGGNAIAKASGVAYVFYASVGPAGRPIIDGILYTVIP